MPQNAQVVQDRMWPDRIRLKRVKLYCYILLSDSSFSEFWPEIFLDFSVRVSFEIPFDGFDEWKGLLFV